MSQHKNNSLIYLETATRIFEAAAYPASQIDIQSLVENMALLEKRGLSKLNYRLIQGGRNVWDTFSEHNFASVLLSHHDNKIPISYEPDEGLRRPPDFKVEIEGVTYWVQMKKLAILERENRQRKIVQEIRNAAKNIEVGKFFGCELSEKFSKNDVTEFIDFITKHVENATDGREYFYPNSEEPTAKLRFWSPNKSELSSLTLGISGDVNIVETTGLAKNQIKQSLENATGAFEWDVNQHVINLVAMDADGKEDIDICDAIFGTEFEVFSKNKQSWSRKQDGFFDLPNASRKVAGVIAMKKKERRPVSDYFFMLFANEDYRHRLNELHKLLPFDEVIFFNMRPPMGQGNFDRA